MTALPVALNLASAGFMFWLAAFGRAPVWGVFAALGALNLAVAGLHLAGPFRTAR